MMSDDGRTVYLRAGLLIDGNGGEPPRDAVVQVEDGRIAQVGRAEDFGTALASTSAVMP
jgi:N-acyl-D-aspartate/D-glutamate deacylase